MASRVDEHHRWTAPTDQFAVRIQVNDAPGFFKKSLVIEPGTRALVIDDGQYLGEIPPGEYTLESFEERLEFWRRKQATVILTRMEDVPLVLCCEMIPTLENLIVDVELRLTVQMSDVGPFLHNLMGARDAVSVAELTEAVQPLARQSLWNAVGRMSITDLTGPDVAEQLSGNVDAAIGVSFQRYGLQFVEVQTVSIRHEKFDEHRRKQGEVWLLKEGIAQQGQLDELYSDDELRRIKKREHQNELQILAQNVKTDWMEEETAAVIRRNQVRNELRAAVQSGEMDKITSREEMKRFLLERDKDRLLRQKERDELTDGYMQRKEDREGARQHLLAMLAINRDQELDQLRADLDHATSVKTLTHEIELSRLSASRDNEEWECLLERQRQDAENRRQERRKELADRWERIRERNRQRRDDSWEELAHQQRMEQLRGDIQISQTERANRIALLQQETDNRLDANKLEAEKRRKDWELDLAERESTSQLDRLQKIQELNARAAEREQRMRIELENFRQDGTHQRELARMEAMSRLSTEALIATSDAANAGLLADLKKHEATQNAAVVQATAQDSEALNAERIKMYERLNETEKQKADAIADAYKTAMQPQQPAVIYPPAGSPPPQILQQPPVAAVPPQPPMPAAGWYVSVNGQQTGPYTDEQVRQQISTGQITAASMLWSTGMAQWTAAGDVSQWSGQFPDSPPPDLPETPTPSA